MYVEVKAALLGSGMMLRTETCMAEIITPLLLLLWTVWHAICYNITVADETDGRSDNSSK